MCIMWMLKMVTDRIVNIIYCLSKYVIIDFTMKKTVIFMPHCNLSLCINSVSKKLTDLTIYSFYYLFPRYFLSY